MACSNSNNNSTSTSNNNDNPQAEEEAADQELELLKYLVYTWNTIIYIDIQLLYKYAFI